MMIRFLAHPTSVVTIGDFIRCTGGVLGCTAMAGAISIGVATPVGAAALVESDPRRSIPPICRHAVSVGDRHTAHKCKEAWLAMYERSRRRSARGREFPRWMERFDRKPNVKRRPPRPKPVEDPSPGRATPPPSRRAASSPPAPPRVTAPEPKPAGGRADGGDTRPSSLQPVLLLGLLIPAAAAICYPFRHRIYAAAGLPLPSAAPTTGPPPLQHRPSLDPFAAPVTGLTGPGAVAGARVLALSALDDYGATSLVVIPRTDATVLFGLGEDELLDDDSAGLFIPGNLDAALAYLETELIIRKNTGVTHGRRLLLVADCGTESARIKKLLARHPGDVSAIILGAWTGESTMVDDTGLVDATPSPTRTLPERLPAMSRNEARDRLLSALAQQRQDQKPPKRRSTPRRP